MYMNIIFVDNSHPFLTPLLKTIVQNYMLYALLNVAIHSVITQLWPTLIVTPFLLTYPIKPSPFTVRSDTRYHILIFSCYIPIHITKQNFTNCATQITKRKEMLCTAILLGCMTTETDPTFFLKIVDAGFYLSGFVTSHNTIYKFQLTTGLPTKRQYMFVRFVSGLLKGQLTSLSPFLLYR